MKRRSFLKNTAITLGGAPCVINGVSLSRLSSMAPLGLVNDSDKVLVLIQLSGGNDGLNTLIPLDQLENLTKHRSGILIDENKMLPISDKNALHPSFSGIKNMYDNGYVNFIQSVAYPNQNRSHFRSTDIWHTASDANIVETEGWLGRYFDKYYPGFPQEYPNAQFTDPFSISVGDLAHATCEGQSGNFSMSVHNVDNFLYLSEDFENTNGINCNSEILSFLKTTNSQSNAYFDRLQEATALGNNLSSKYSENSLSENLKIIAKLISGGLKTKVYIVNYGNFDTHAEQVDPNDTSQGTHANELRVVSDSIAAFHEDLNLLGVGDKVLGMTYSEFGRQISSEGYGTDHGTAGPVMLFGNCVRGGIIGQNPEIFDEIEPQAGVPMLFDFRSVYASIYNQWFGLDKTDISELINGEFPSLRLVQNCSVSSVNDFQNISLKVYPSPAQDVLRIELNEEKLIAGFQLAIYDSIGSELIVENYTNHSSPIRTILINVALLIPGQYFIRLISAHAAKTASFTKI